MTREQAAQLYATGEITVYTVDHERIRRGELTDTGCGIAMQVDGLSGLFQPNENTYVTYADAETAVEQFMAEKAARSAEREQRKSAPKPRRTWRYNAMNDGEPEGCINSEL